MIIDIECHDTETELKNNINDIISDTIIESNQYHAAMLEAPIMIKGYVNFRAILRDVKRGEKLDDAIKARAFESCPPHDKNELEVVELTCGNISCCECWNRFCTNYVKSLTDSQ